MPMRCRLQKLLEINPYDDYSGGIYALLEYLPDPVTGVLTSVRVKYGLTGNLERRRSEYGKCGHIEWLYYWPTDNVRHTGRFPSSSLR